MLQSAILVMQRFRGVYHGISHELLVFSQYTHEHLENTVANTINATYVSHAGKVGYNTVEYTTAFLYYYWLCFLWHGINSIMIFGIAVK